MKVCINILIKDTIPFSLKYYHSDCVSCDVSETISQFLLSEFSLTDIIARLGSSGFLVLLQDAACAAETKITSFYNLPYESASLSNGLCLQHRNHHLSLPSRQHHAMNIHE